MRSTLLFALLVYGSSLVAQVYIVNSDDDKNDGICDGIHCSLREAIMAAETDGLPSSIEFNIPGAGPHEIIPNGSFPTILQDDLDIFGETQTGGPGSIVINFKNRDFGGIGFWNILGRRFKISGIDFKDFLFSDKADHIFQFGDITSNSSESKISNCSFINANTSSNSSTRLLIIIFKADNFQISNNYFGTDHTKSVISKLYGYIQIEKTQGLSKVNIDSNIFVNTTRMIKGFGGDLHISKNIFGALDTLKTFNFLNPDNAISGDHVMKAFIQDNYFINFRQYAIGFSASNGELIISKNRFFDCLNEVIFIGGNTRGKNFVTDNYARHGGFFIDAITNQNDEYIIERNDVDDFDNFLTISNYLNEFNKFIRYIDNRMTCINREVVNISQGGQSPLIQFVNANLISGTGNPNDSIIIYYNERTGCPNANCQGGIELGRTKADPSGNWNLSANIPSPSSFSAYQFNGDTTLLSNRYTGFSPCLDISTNTDDQILKTGIKAFPNPTNDFIKFELKHKPVSILIYNSKGQKLNQLFNNSKQLEIDLANYNPGIYYFQFIGENFHEISKIIKN